MTENVKKALSLQQMSLDIEEMGEAQSGAKDCNLNHFKVTDQMLSPCPEEDSDSDYEDFYFSE